MATEWGDVSDPDRARTLKMRRHFMHILDFGVGSRCSPGSFLFKSLSSPLIYESSVLLPFPNKAF